MSPDRTVLLVEDGSGVTALAAARALHAAGWQVVIGAPGGRSPATVSRRCAAAGHVRPLALGSEQDWLADVRALARRTAARVVVPCGDAELVTLSAARDELPGLTVPYPEHPVVLRALDKQLLAQAAARVGLAAPLTEPAPPGVLPSFDGTVVVKPRVHGPVRGPDRVEVQVLASGALALARADAVRAAGAEPLYQRHAPGRLIAQTVVRSRAGHVLARVQQEASRTYPVPAGSCVRGRTVEPTASLCAAVDQLLAELGWWGLVQLELQQTTEGAVQLVDANPRPYGTLALAEAAGARLCATWLTDALGSGAAAPVARAGVGYQALGLDLRRALQERRGTLPADVLATAWVGRQRPVRPVWSIADPAPFARLVRTVLGRLRAPDRTTAAVPPSRRA